MYFVYSIIINDITVEDYVIVYLYNIILKHRTYNYVVTIRIFCITRQIKYYSMSNRLWPMDNVGNRRSGHRGYSLDHASFSINPMEFLK